MAITASAKRALRTASRKRVYNLRRMNTMRDAVKDVKGMILKKNVAEAEKSLPTVFKAIDKAAKRGVIGKNTAARKKSRIVAMMRKQSEKAK